MRSTVRCGRVRARQDSRSTRRPTIERAGAQRGRGRCNGPGAADAQAGREAQAKHEADRGRWRIGSGNRPRQDVAAGAPRDGFTASSRNPSARARRARARCRRATLSALALATNATMRRAASTQSSTLATSEIRTRPRPGLPRGRVAREVAARQHRDVLLLRTSRARTPRRRRPRATGRTRPSGGSTSSTSRSIGTTAANFSR